MAKKQSRVRKIPDMQEDGKPAVSGITLDKVGVRNVHTMARFARMGGAPISLPVKLSAYVSLSDPDKKGINMSRLPRVVLQHMANNITTDLIHNILIDFKKNLGSSESYLKLRFWYPIERMSLKSKEEAPKMYECVLEGKAQRDQLSLFLTVNVDYSSSCPCSQALVESLQKTNKGVPKGIAHSQRSKATVTVQFSHSNVIYIEELVDVIESALKTPTQVIVRRPDEKEFGVLSYANQKFVEDAVRLVSSELDKFKRVQDYVVVCNHFESLHSFDAVAIRSKGIPGGLR